MKTVKEDKELTCMRHVDLAKTASERDVYARRWSVTMLLIVKVFEVPETC